MSLGRWLRWCAPLPGAYLFLDKYFTHIKTFSTKRVDLDIVKGDRRMAPFGHPLVGGKVMRNAGYATESYAPRSSTRWM